MFFFFNDTATTEIYTLSLHDALPILQADNQRNDQQAQQERNGDVAGRQLDECRRSEDCGIHLQTGEPRPECIEDRKSTRLNSSHANISYAVFCLKKKT